MKFSWVTTLNDQLSFGPRPKSPEDMTYVIKRLGLHHVVNASRSTQTVSKDSRALERDAYVRDYKGRFDFAVTDVQLSPEALVTPATLLREVRTLAEQLQATRRDEALFVHAENGLYEEAYIGLLLWRLLYPQEAPKDVVRWMAEHEKEALFDDDEDKRQVLLDCWALLDAEDERDRKLRVFGVPVKRRKK